jgi:hypothetical protein
MTKAIAHLLLLSICCRGSSALTATASQVCVNSSDCLHGGSCKVFGRSNGDITHSNTGDSYYCHCAANYTGPNCETFCPIDCYNGGTCDYKPTEHANNAMLTDYVCICRSGWKGLQCDIAVNICPDGHECLNGATCRVSDSDDTLQMTYSCTCPYTHEGVHCEHDVVRIARCADGSHCFNGGTCVTASAGAAPSKYTCMCPGTHQGEHCEKATAAMSETSNSTTPPSTLSSSGVIVAIVLGIVVVTSALLLAVVLRGRCGVGAIMMKSGKRSLPRVDASTTVAELDADGSSTMKNYHGQAGVPITAVETIEPVDGRVVVQHDDIEII